MMHQINNQTIPTAPLMTRPRSAFQVQLGALSFEITGEDRLQFGTEAVNGFTTGCDAHAAVRMHASPAIGAPWSYDRKGKAVATAPSAGKLRTR